MGATGRFFVTPHALRRYIERIRPGMCEREAREELLRYAARAKVVRRTRNKGVLMRAPRPLRFRFVVGPGTGVLPAILTVLPPHDGWNPRPATARKEQGR